MKVEDLIDLNKDLKLSYKEQIDIAMFAKMLFQVPDRNDMIPLIHIAPEMRQVVALVISKGLEAIIKEEENE